MSNTTNKIALPQNELQGIAVEIMREMNKAGKLPCIGKVYEGALDHMVAAALDDYRDRLQEAGRLNEESRLQKEPYMEVKPALQHLVNVIERGNESADPQLTAKHRTSATLARMNGIESYEPLPPNLRLGAELRDANFVELATEKAQAEWASRARYLLQQQEGTTRDTSSQAVPDKTPSSERKK